MCEGWTRLLQESVARMCACASEIVKISLDLQISLLCWILVAADVC